jgi:hypothetical protein
VVALLFAPVVAHAEQPAGWKAGAAAARITPDKPLVLLGFPDRAGPFTSVGSDIWAKALALEDPAGNRAVIITADLVGFQAHYTTDPVAARLVKLTGLPRERFLFNASHTHTAPLVSLDPRAKSNIAHPPLTDIDAKQTKAYTQSLQDKLVGVAMEALKKLEPATLSYGVGEVPFPTSRRTPTPAGVVMTPNPAGLTDRGVPVLRVDGPDGKPQAILFGCACHCVAMGAANVLHGDYAGVAQAALQERHPGAIALFMAGCGADANPEPMGSPAAAQQHGKTLADEVDKVLSADRKPRAITGTLSTRYAEVKLPLADLSRETIKPYLALPNFQARQAAHMLEVLDAGGTLPKEYVAPVAVWQFGNDLTLVALPGEPVAEYVPRVIRALNDRKPENIWIAGYNNDCFGYLPTALVIQEGGHEAIGVTLWAWGNDVNAQVGFFAPAVQDVIVKTVTELAK